MPSPPDNIPSNDEINSTLARTLANITIGTKRNPPYFNEEAAQTVLDAVHMTLTTCKPVIWSAEGTSINTLYLRFRQGAQYITNKLDPDFPEKLAMVQVTRLPKIGLRIAPREGRTRITEQVPWKADFEAFLDSSVPGNAFERINLGLSDEEISWIHEQLYELRKFFTYEVSPTKLILVRVA